MPRFFFGCIYKGFEEQCIGHDLPDRHEAHRMGIRFAGEILQDDAEALAEGHDLQVTVSDDS